MNFSLDLILNFRGVFNHHKSPFGSCIFFKHPSEYLTPAFMMLSSHTMAVQFAGQQMRLINFIK